jgi:hypothetical protein
MATFLPIDCVAKKLALSAPGRLALTACGAADCMQTTPEDVMIAACQALRMPIRKATLKFSVDKVVVKVSVRRESLRDNVPIPVPARIDGAPVLVVRAGVWGWTPVFLSHNPARAARRATAYGSDIDATLKPESNQRIVQRLVTNYFAAWLEQMKHRRDVDLPQTQEHIATAKRFMDSAFAKGRADDLTMPVIAGWLEDWQQDLDYYEKELPAILERARVRTAVARAAVQRGGVPRPKDEAAVRKAREAARERSRAQSAAHHAAEERRRSRWLAAAQAKRR